MPGAGLPGGSAAAPSNMVANDADNTLAEGVDFALGTVTGTKIGTATSQLLGFFNHAPVVQQAAVADPAAGGTVDTQARTAVIGVITALENLGLIATI